MADNITAKANVGAGTEVLATDDVGGVHYPRTKIAHGLANTTPVDTSATDPLPVTLPASQISSLAPLATVGVNNFPATQTVAGAVSVSNFPGTQPVSGPLTDTQLRATPVPVSTSSLPLPTGAATEATLAAVSGKLNSLGQKTMANSAPVVIASDQSSLPVSGPLTDAQIRATALPVSAASLPLPTGAASETTLSALNNKTPALGVAAPSASIPVTLPNDVVVGIAASVAAINTDLLTGVVSGWFDAANYHSVAIQIVGGAGISAGAIFFEGTNDTTAAPSGNIWPVEEVTTLTPTPNVAAVTITASTVRMFAGPVTTKFVRVRSSTAFVGGTVQAIAVFSQLPYARMVQTVHQATAANLNVALASTTITSISAGTNAIGDTGVQYRASATGAATIAKVLAAASNNATLVKATAGRVVGWDFTNNATAVRYVKLFNKATAPVPGTDTPVESIGIPPNGGKASYHAPGGIGLATGIGFCVVTGAADLDNTAVAANDVVGALHYA